MAATPHYDDPAFSYEKYWQSRDYEQASEELCINHLLEGKKLKVGVDLGGGYGRLSSLLRKYCKKVTLVEPSRKQRRIAQQYLGSDPSVTILPGTAEKTGLPPASADLVIMVRVMHHLPDPLPALKEIHRILKPGGIMILEYANSTNFKSRIRSLLTGQPILLTPIEKRSVSNIRRNTIPFVNHHPHTIDKLLNRAGFTVSQKLSVSNFRIPFLKRRLGMKSLLVLESKTQKRLASFNFGPSIFLLAHKES